MVRNDKVRFEHAGESADVIAFEHDDIVFEVRFGADALFSGKPDIQALACGKGSIHDFWKKTQ